MKHPNSIYDLTMFKEEPLRSYFSSLPIVPDENNQGFKENRQKLAADLKKDGNVEAVRTWLNFAFPAHHAPHGKDISKDTTAFDLFLDFHWIYKRYHVKRAREFLERERVNRGWPAKISGVTPPDNLSTNKTDLSGREKFVKTESAGERKPIIPLTSHVTRNKFSNLHFSKTGSRSKSGNISQQETDQNTTQLPPSFPPPTISSQCGSSMQELYPVSDTRASSPLSECESAWSVEFRAFEARIAAEVPSGAPSSVFNHAHLPNGEVVTLKPKHITAGMKSKKDPARSGERRVSARLNGGASKQSPTTKNMASQGKSPCKKVTVPKKKRTAHGSKRVVQVQKTHPATIDHQSVTVKKDPSDPQISQSVPCNPGDSTNAEALSGRERQYSNITEPRKAKISSERLSQITSVTTIRRKGSSRNKRIFAKNSQSSESVSVPIARQQSGRREDESKSHIEEQSDRRGRLRPRFLDSSGNPTHVSPIPNIERSSDRSDIPLKRTMTETLNPNKKRRLSKNTTNVEKQEKLDFQVVKRAHSTNFSGESSLKSKGTRCLKKVVPKASVQETLDQGIKGEESYQASYLHLGSEASSTVKAPISPLKRKRSQLPAVINKNVQSREKADHLDEINKFVSKKWRGHTHQSLKEIDRISGNNEKDTPLENSEDLSNVPKTSLLEINSIPGSHSDVEITTNLSFTTFNPEDHIPRPPKISEEALLITPKTHFGKSASTIHPHRDHAWDKGLEITKPIKEEILEALVLTESRSPPIYNSSLQEYDQEINPLPSEDLILVEEWDKQFTYPDEHPDNYCRFPKPPLPEMPPIWAESRQELCESFDWFRSYQGGVYHAHNMTKGYLLSGFPASRDRFEHGGRLIISHGGGKAESIHCHKGRLESQPATDQLAQDKSVRALFDNFVNNRPLALVMDDRYALFPYDLRAKNVTYAVLGFYTIAHAWAEYQSSNNETGRVIRYKFAFRWCDDQGPPWWDYSLKDGIHEDLVGQSDPMMISGTRSESPRPSDTQKKTIASDELENEREIQPPNKLQGIVKDCLDRQCSSCSRNSLQVFLAWSCLYPQCSAFWKSDDGRPLPISMGYNPQFLKLCPSKPIPAGFGDLKPQMILELTPQTIMKTMYSLTRGFHCLNCGRLSCRDKWEKMECMNPSCYFTVKITGKPRTADSLLNQTPTIAFKDYALNPISDIQQLPPASFRHENGRGIVQTFILPYKNARIHHIKSGNFLGRQEPDSIFIDYQEQATSGELKFRRWPMRAHKCRGSLLTNYFSQNTGEPYKYVGGDENTVPFEGAPGAVVRARDLIQRRVAQALRIPARFNEVLSAAYMERQKMAFHSDDEVGLGPLVAGLSLGSPALMHFRLLAKHDIDREKRGILLSIVLRHGDILVMDGAAVQGYYEHTVVPTNFRIAATARYIGADHA